MNFEKHGLDVNMNLTIVDFNPAAGMALQGDVVLLMLPAHYSLNRNNPIPTGDRLIVALGEATGHHHSIDVSHQRNTAAVVSKLLSDAQEAAKNVPVTPEARIYKDDAIVTQLVSDNILTRKDLAIGILEIVGGSMVLEHQEHNGIRLPEGCYYVGRQIESAGAEQRLVAD